MRRPTPLRRIVWASRRRCPNCGQRDIFSRWFVMVPDCPRCGIHFERMPGYWLGAMILNFAATALAFFGVFGVALAVTWPDPPWTLVWIFSMAVALISPFVLFPWSRTLFAALELAVRPPEAHEVE